MPTEIARSRRTHSARTAVKSPQPTEMAEATTVDRTARPASRIELGRQLREIRQRIVQSQPLLNGHDLERELRDRRGESSPDRNS